MSIRKKQLLSSLLWGTIGTLLGSAAFYWLIMKTVEGQFTAGDILAFTSVIVLTSQTLLALVQESSLLYDTLLYIEKFKNFLKLKSGVVSGNERLKHGIKTIEFQSVSFKYPKSERYALKDISFQLNKGEKTALVGENGSGKSTVMKLICRLYDVSEGRILINNRDIKTYDIDSLRKEIGIVFQDYSKYHLSLRENIAVSDIESFADNEKLRYAVEKSNVSELMTSYRIDFEQILGKTFSGGKELSEGEWQKIAISRAYFKQNSLFLFDEPSSALDAISENTFFENVKQLSENKTVLFVTHKLSGATLSDKIIVLDNGRKIEEGHHPDLMKLKGKYSRLFSLQAERYL
jgi:ATP-binding cassette subfamily B protein